MGRPREVVHCVVCTAKAALYPQKYEEEELPCSLFCSFNCLLKYACSGIKGKYLLCEEHQNAYRKGKECQYCVEEKVYPKESNYILDRMLNREIE